MNEIKKNDLNENEKWCFRSSIIRNRFFWRIFIWILSSCCIWKYVMIIHFHFISFLILDLPKLQTISFNGQQALQGGNRDNYRTMINGHESYDNTLIMKSMWIELKWNEMWIVFWWLFRSSFTHSNSGKSIIYSPIYGICDIGKYDMIWYDMIWYDLIRHSKSHWIQHSLRK